LALSSTDGRMACISSASAADFIEGESTMPMLSLSNQAHRASAFPPFPPWTHAALPPPEPALTT